MEDKRNKWEAKDEKRGEWGKDRTAQYISLSTHGRLKFRPCWGGGGGQLRQEAVHQPAVHLPLPAPLPALVLPTLTLASWLEKGMPGLPDFRLRAMNRTFFKSFITKCPLVSYTSVLLPVLRQLCPFMLLHMKERWSYLIKVRENPSFDEDNTTEFSCWPKWSEWFSLSICFPERTPPPPPIQTQKNLAKMEK